jgi:hypothetical protein
MFGSKRCWTVILVTIWFWGALRHIQ